MKLQTTILLGSLIFSQSIIFPSSASVQTEGSCVLSVCRRRHNVDLNNKYQHRNKRSVLPVATGYVEDDVLYLSFSLPLSNTQIRVVDSETSKTVFEGIVSGTSCSIPLDRDSESFEIYF